MKYNPKVTLVVMFSLLVFIGVMAKLSNKEVKANETKPDSVAQPEKAVKPTAEQLMDKQYLADNYEIESWSACSNKADAFLKSVAAYDFQWDDKLTESKFVILNIPTRAPGIMILASDKLKLQNGFGAWSRKSLVCVYDTQNNVVLGYKLM